MAGLPATPAILVAVSCHSCFRYNRRESCKKQPYRWLFPHAAANKIRGDEQISGHFFMNFDSNTLIILAGFVLLALASRQIGRFLTRFKLPLISGFLLAGILIGPYGFGFIWAINYVGEAHPRHETPAFDGVNDAIIFGVDGQSIALAKQLQNHGWGVRVACLDETLLNGSAGELTVLPVDRFSITSLRELSAENADAIVAMLSDEENYQIAELAYEHFGTPSIVVRLNDRSNFEEFHRLGVLIVDPATVMVGLLDHFVRSPTVASLLEGMEEGQDVVEFEIRNKDLDGIFLRELRMPLDTLVLNVHRDEHALISHGYTRLRCGDRLTVVGSVEGINELMLRFDSQDV